MFSYIISYDLISNKDYDSLYKAIRNYGSYAHVLESVWIIKSATSSADIRNNLKSYIDNNDKLFVAKLTGESAWCNLSKEVSDWIHNNN